MQMGLCAYATLVAVAIMYIHSMAYFGHPVPQLLRKIVFLPSENVVEGGGQEKSTLFTNKNTIDNKISCNIWILKLLYIDFSGFIAEGYEAHMPKHDDGGEKKEKKAFDDAWDSVCFRMDLFNLVVFETLNLILFGVWFGGWEWIKTT